MRKIAMKINEFICYRRKISPESSCQFKKKRNKDAKSRKNTADGISIWTERRCISNDVEDLEDGNKLIAHEIIASLASVVVLIAAKSMLKILQNNNLKSILDTTHSATQNLWPLHVHDVANARHHCFLVAHVFTSSETTMSCEFLLESTLQLH